MGFGSFFRNWQGTTPAKPYQMSQALQDRLGPDGLARMQANRDRAAALRQQMGYGQQVPQNQMMARFTAGMLGGRPSAQPQQPAGVVNPKETAGKMTGVRAMGYADGGKVIKRKCNGKPK